MFAIEPAAIAFPFNEIKAGQKPYTKTVKLRNTSSEKCRFSVIVLEEQSEFKILQKKAGAVFPGKFETVIIQYMPQVWGLTKGTFYVKSSNFESMIPVQITGLLTVAYH